MSPFGSIGSPPVPIALKYLAGSSMFREIPTHPVTSFSQFKPRGMVASSLPSMNMFMPFPWPLVVITRWCHIWLSVWASGSVSKLAESLLPPA